MTHGHQTVRNTIQDPYVCNVSSPSQKVLTSQNIPSFRTFVNDRYTTTFPSLSLYTTYIVIVSPFRTSINKIHLIIPSEVSPSLITRSRITDLSSNRFSNSLIVLPDQIRLPFHICFRPL